MVLKQWIKSNKYLHGPFRFAKKNFYYIWSNLEERRFKAELYLVSKGVINQDKRYTNIKRLCNKYQGQRCFIVATGPSLTLSDLNKLKNEYTISMNSIVNILPKTDFRPNIYLCQDKAVYRRIKQNISLDVAEEVFLGVGNMGALCNSCITYKDIKACTGMSFYRLDTASIYYQVNYEKRKFNPKFSLDCSKWIGDGTTVTYSAIQLAAYMGFTEIYLIGVDCNYNLPKAHIDAYDVGVVYDKAEEMYINNSKAYKLAFEEQQKRGVGLYNATRGGALEVLPRVNLDELCP